MIISLFNLNNCVTYFRIFLYKHSCSYKTNVVNTTDILQIMKINSLRSCHDDVTKLYIQAYVFKLKAGSQCQKGSVGIGSKHFLKFSV